MNQYAKYQQHHHK